MLNKFRERFEHLLEKLSIPFIKFGVEPTTITVLGVLSAFSAAILFSLSSKYTFLFSAGILLFTLSCVFDVLDGAVARSSRKISLRGSFTDSLSDRVNEAAVLIGLMLGGIVDLIWGLLFLVTSFLVSYIRARGEGLGVNLSGVGIMERAERMILVLIGLLLYFLSRDLTNYVLAVGVVLNSLTSAQRVSHVLSKLS